MIELRDGNNGTVRLSQTGVWSVVCRRRDDAVLRGSSLERQADVWYASRQVVESTQLFLKTYIISCQSSFLHMCKAFFRLRHCKLFKLLHNDIVVDLYTYIMI